jgi:hypothetical protein
MGPRSILLALTLLALTMLALLASACQSRRSGYERARDTSEQLEEYRTVTLRLSDQVGLTLDSLLTLAQEPNAELRSSAETFQTFERELSNLELLSAKARRLYGKMDARAQAFFGGWTQESAMIESVELRQRAEERRAAVQASFHTLSQSRLESDLLLQRLIDQLGDLRAYLEHDLTGAGLASAKDQIAQAVQDGRALQELLGASAEAEAAAMEALAPLEARAPAREPQAGA